MELPPVKFEEVSVSPEVSPVAYKSARGEEYKRIVEAENLAKYINEYLEDLGILTKEVKEKMPEAVKYAYKKVKEVI